MAKSYVKINYSKRNKLGLPMPFYHTYLEVSYENKIIKIGYYAITNLLWCLSLLIPVPGEVRLEKRKIAYSIIVSKDSKEAKKVIKLVKSKKYKWKVYTAFFKNCFDWRNAILKEAGINPPRGDWFWKIT